MGPDEGCGLEGTPKPKIQGPFPQKKKTLYVGRCCTHLPPPDNKATMPAMTSGGPTALRVAKLPVDHDDDNDKNNNDSNEDHHDDDNDDDGSDVNHDDQNHENESSNFRKTMVKANHKHTGDPEDTRCPKYT